MTARQWFAFGVVSITWGTAYFWYKIALRELGPLPILIYRMGFGVVTLAVVFVRHENTERPTSA